MILIADSGSTKTDWVLMDGHSVIKRVKTQGINPFHQNSKIIFHVLLDELLPHLSEADSDIHDTGEVSFAPGIKAVYFYGSGCTPERCHVVEDELRHVFPDADAIEVKGDLLAAARAVCGHQQGVACILGTGANSCCYDGKKIILNTPPLGYILGDEGSGAVLGRLFLNALFKGFLPESLKIEFLEYSGMTYSDVINRVYSQPLANRYLASIANFIARHLEGEESLRLLIADNFHAFFHRNFVQYHPWMEIHFAGQKPVVGFVGGIANQFREILAEVTESEGFRIGIVMKSPIDGLIQYHNY